MAKQHWEKLTSKKDEKCIVCNKKIYAGSDMYWYILDDMLICTNNQCLAAVKSWINNQDFGI